MSKLTPIVPVEDTHLTAFEKVNRNFEVLLDEINNSGVARIREEFVAISDESIVFDLQKGSYVLGTNSLQVIVNGSLLVAGSGLYELSSTSFKLMQNVPAGTRIIALYSKSKDKNPVVTDVKTELITSSIINYLSPSIRKGKLVSDNYSSFGTSILVNYKYNFYGESDYLIKGNYDINCRLKLSRITKPFDVLVNISEISITGESRVLKVCRFNSSNFSPTIQYSEFSTSIHLGELMGMSKLGIEVSLVTDNLDDAIFVDYVNVQKSTVNSINI